MNDTAFNMVMPVIRELREQRMAIDALVCIVPVPAPSRDWNRR